MEHTKEIPPAPQEITVFLHQENGQAAENARPQPPHHSPACDLILVRDGSCKLLMDSSQTLLVPGDLLLIGAGCGHRILPSASGKAYQCFFPEEPAAREIQRLCGLLPQRAAARNSDLQRRIRALRLFHASPSDIAALHADASPELRYMTHLERAELDYIEGFFQHIWEEQENRLTGSQQMRLTYLQQMMILLARIRLRELETDKMPKSWKYELVEHVLQEIDLHLAENIDFEEIARQQGITVTYLRSIFKGIVGSPPLDYLNRVRIMDSLELLQTSDLPIAEIAAQVGISDANYFSRLFKKIIGYSPSYFKSIPSADGGTARTAVLRGQRQKD